jgi:hypothetical protein
MTTTDTFTAVFAKRRGFLCGEHVLYCPDLSKVNDTMPFYLYCPRHDKMFAIDIATQSAEFIEEFPSGCKATA